MNIKFTPSLAKGKITAPPSKSASHRALIAGALSEKSVIHNLGRSNDIDSTLNCLKLLGAGVETNGNTITIGGLDPENIRSCTIDAGESGSTLRFLIPLCLMSGNPVTIHGHGNLLHRPLEEYSELCKEKGFDFILKDDSLTVCGNLKSGDHKISGQRSSQFATGMMYALSAMNEKSTLEITGKAESISYIYLTEQIMKDFGVKMKRQALSFSFEGNGYLSREFHVEGDYSNSAFLEAFNVLGGEVEINGLREDSTQGDKVCKELFEKLQSSKTIDLSDCPDLAPVLFALSAIYGGSFTGTKRLRLKESDRIKSMKEELRKCGIRLDDGENHVIISNKGLKSPDEIICGHNDHRIVMAMSVLLSRIGGSISGTKAVFKSWPEYFDVISSLGIDIKYEDD